MPKRYVLSLTAASRTGILAAVSTALSELGGDIHEISQTSVRSFAAMILAADFPDHRDPKVIVGHLEGVCRPFGIAVILKDPDSETPSDALSSEGERYILTLTGRDEPGIVARISARLAREGIDITDLQGARSDDDQSFTLMLQLSIPAGADLSLLEADLRKLDASLGISARLARYVPSGSTTEF